MFIKKFFENINWGVRFNRDNLMFMFRFAFALSVPVLAYFNLEVKDLTTWDAVWQVVVQFLSNPFLVFLTLSNAVNMTSDPTTPGFFDSPKAMTYEVPGVIGGKNI